MNEVHWSFNYYFQGIIGTNHVSEMRTIKYIWLMTIHLWLSHALECRLTNHSAAKNELRQRSDTFSQRSIDFNAGVSYFWSRQAITVVVLSKIWLNVVPGAFVTQIRVSQRGWRGVSVFFPSQNRSQILTSVVFGSNWVFGRPHSQAAKPLKYHQAHFCVL